MKHFFQMLIHMSCSDKHSSSITLGYENGSQLGKQLSDLWILKR
jgi:hypothetical protein